jgi:hypothetical protein
VIWDAFIQINAGESETERVFCTNANAPSNATERLRQDLVCPAIGRADPARCSVPPMSAFLIGTWSRDNWSERRYRTSAGGDRPEKERPMATNERRDKPVQVKKGKSAPGRRAAGLESPAARRGADELDARQARMREVRRKGPELRSGENRAALEAPRPPAPPTECDDENDQ